MAEFKPMVKMYTDEPSVILKLKKGGKVKAHDDGFKSMTQTSGGNPFEAAEHGKAPKKPSMAQRMKAMNPNQYAKGGKVAHKVDGGMMAGAPAMAPAAVVPRVKPMARPAVAAMAPAARAARAAMVRRALTGMKKGGSAGMEKHIAKLEKELKHHEAMSAKRAHGKASGGEIDAAETKTTLKNSVAPYAKTKMDTSHKDTAHGTGEVKEGRPGGYKKGGKAKMAMGGCYAMGGSIEGNEGPFENTKMVSAGKGKTNGTTGGVRMSNAGGYKKGGKAYKASGGAIDAKLTRTTVEGGNWENRAANTSKPGKVNTKTGGVKEANAGGYRRGGKIGKFAEGGDVPENDGRGGAGSSKPYTPPKYQEPPDMSPDDAYKAGVSGAGSKYDAPEGQYMPIPEGGPSLIEPWLQQTGQKQSPSLPGSPYYTSSPSAPMVGMPEYQPVEPPRYQPAEPSPYVERPPREIVDPGPVSVGQGFYRTPGGTYINSSGYPVAPATALAGQLRATIGPRPTGGMAFAAKGGSAKKAYATGGNVVNDGRAVKMPRHFVSQPVANSLQSGTFKRGGHVRKADGGNIPPDIASTLKTAENERAYKNWERSQKEEAQEDRALIPNLVKRAVSGVKGLFSGPKPPEGSVTKTERSVTVSPASAPGRKRGGKC